MEETEMFLPKMYLGISDDSEQESNLMLIRKPLVDVLVFFIFP